MSITDELREWYRDRLFMGNGWAEIDAIADRIDAEYESACAEAYGNGVMSVPIALDENAWVKLPLDADGVPIRIGDVMEWPDGDDEPFEVVGIGDGVLFYVENENDGPAEWTGASTKRHHHAPTVEDVLREFAEKVIDSQIPNVHPTYDEAIAEYAAKLRLAGDAE